MAKRNSLPLFPTEQDGESVQCILCGESVAPAFIQAHEKVACSRRTVRCLRCKDSIYLNEFSLHESLCAGSLYKLPRLHKDIGTEIIQVSTEEETKSSRASQNECTVQISSARQSPYDEEDTTKPASSESPQERPSSRPDGAAAAVPSPREESPPPPILPPAQEAGDKDPPSAVARGGGGGGGGGGGQTLEAASRASSVPGPAAPPAPCPQCGAAVAAGRAEDHRRAACPGRPVACPLGCGETLPLNQAQAHRERACARRPLPCPRGCGRAVAAAGLAAHAAGACPRRPVPCPLACGAQLAAEEAGAHAAGACPRGPARCPKCGAGGLARGDLPEHARAACPQRAVVCPDCGEGMRSYELMAHRAAACPERLATCTNEGCSQQVKIGLLEEHIGICPFSSYGCQCGQTVLNSQRKEHLLRCSLFKRAWTMQLGDSFKTLGVQNIVRGVKIISETTGVEGDIALCSLIENSGHIEKAKQKLLHPNSAEYQNEMELAAKSCEAYKYVRKKNNMKKNNSRQEGSRSATVLPAPHDSIET